MSNPEPHEETDLDRALAASGLRLPDDDPSDDAGPSDLDAALAASGLVLPPVPDPSPADQEPSWTDKLRNVEVGGVDDLLLGLGEGASFGHGAELGGFGAELGDTIYNALHRTPAGTKAGRTAGDMGAELSEHATGTAAGGLGNVLGTIAGSGALLPLGGASVAGQAALGTAQGIAGAHGGDEDLLGGGLVGGALGGLGGLAAKGIGAAGKMLAPVAKGSWSAGREAFEALLAKVAPRAEMALKPWELPGSLLATGGLKVAEKLAPHAARAQPLTRALGQAGAQTGGSLLGDELSPTGKASAQEKAYAGKPTESWAVQSVLSSGRSGLPPDDEQRLTEAIMSGDDDRVVSTNFVLSQRHPEYAKRLQDEYRSLQGGE